MATFKEAVASQRWFRFNHGPWMLYDVHTGKLKTKDGWMGSDVLQTAQALSDRWEIQAPDAKMTWWRPKLIWCTHRKRYVEGREWFRSKLSATATLTSNVKVIEWESKEMPEDGTMVAVP